LIPFWCSNQGLNDVSKAMCHLFFIDLNEGSLISKHKFSFGTLDIDYTHTGLASMIVVKD